jgi:hypothetical protein
LVRTPTGAELDLRTRINEALSSEILLIVATASQPSNPWLISHIEICIPKRKNRPACSRNLIVPQAGTESNKVNAAARQLNPINNADFRSKQL